MTAAPAMINGKFVHPCVYCGEPGSFGYGVQLRRGILGTWYCAAHRPKEGANTTSTHAPADSYVYPTQNFKPRPVQKPDRHRQGQLI